MPRAYARLAIVNRSQSAIEARADDRLLGQISAGQSKIIDDLPPGDVRLVAMAEEMLERFGVEDGCIHFEAKYSSRGPVPIEINQRMGGDEVYDFIRIAWGVDLVENAA